MPRATLGRGGDRSDAESQCQDFRCRGEFIHGHRHGLGLPFPIEGDGYLLADIQTRSQISQARPVGHVAIGQLDDHVSPLEPRAFGRAARLDIDDQGTAIIGQVESPGRLGVEC